VRLRAPQAAVAAAVAGLALLAVAASRGATPIVDESATFEAYALPGQSGVTCPRRRVHCRNRASGAVLADGRPGLLAAARGAAWLSRDGGRRFTALRPLPGTPVAAAFATARDVRRRDDAFVLTRTGSGLALLVSRDAGRTWEAHAVPAPTPDHAALAVDGVRRACVAGQSGSLGLSVACSADGGRTFGPWTSVLDSGHGFQRSSVRLGGLAFDHRRHVLYQAYSAIASSGENAFDHGVYVAVSADGGKSWSDSQVYVAPQPVVSYAQRAVSLAVDRHGDLFAVFADGHRIWLCTSLDGGRSWAPPRRVDVGAGTALFPVAVAGDRGRLAVVYAKTPYSNGDQPGDSFPVGAVWWVALAETTRALRDGVFHEHRASPPIHYGGLCAVGPGCGADDHLNGVLAASADLATGLVTALYTSDQFDPQAPGAPGCGAEGANTGACVHAMATVQTSGTRILTRATARAAGAEVRRQRRRG
jgi:hypothetical protein